MSRRVLALAAAVLATAGAAPALAHEGDPNMLSEVREVTPDVPGVSVSVLNRDDRLLISNTSQETVLVRGYENEPYARIKADGTVEVNERSPAHYLNEERNGDVPVPDHASAGAEPQWRQVSRSGRFEFHDHRMHWMGEGRPPQIQDTGERTKIFDYRVPIEIGGRPGAIAGTLTWTPSADGGLPLGAILAFAGLVIGGCVVVIVVRRRRSAPAGRVRDAEAW